MAIAHIAIVICSGVVAIPCPIGIREIESFDHFAGEVFEQMTALDRDVLMHVATLPNTTEAMAMAISATPSAARRWGGTVWAQSIR